MSMDQPSIPFEIDLERWVRMRRRLDAPPDRIYRTWTDPEELARWFPERIEGGLAVGSRSALVWSDHRIWWDVTQASPSRIFAFRRAWLPDERLITETQITIDPAGYGTRLELEDGPFPLGLPGAIEAWAEAIETWSDALAKLRAHVDFSVDLRARG